MEGRESTLSVSDPPTMLAVDEAPTKTRLNPLPLTVFFVKLKQPNELTKIGPKLESAFADKAPCWAFLAVPPLLGLMS